MSRGPGSGTARLWAIRLVLVGLVVELVSLFGLYHPWGFMLFAGGACLALGAGVLLFVWAAVSEERGSSPGEAET